MPLDLSFNCMASNSSSDLFHYSVEAYEPLNNLNRQYLLISLQPDVIGRIARRYPEMFSDVSDLEKYTRNLVKAQIFYETFNLKSLEEYPGYQVSKNDVIKFCSYFFKR